MAKADAIIRTKTDNSEGSLCEEGREDERWEQKMWNSGLIMSFSVPWLISSLIAQSAMPKTHYDDVDNWSLIATWSIISKTRRWIWHCRSSEGSSHMTFYREESQFRTLHIDGLFCLHSSRLLIVMWRRNRLQWFWWKTNFCTTTAG